MERRNHRLRLVLHLALLGLVLLVCPVAGSADEGGDGGALPLKKVLLFSSGVGYFEHRAEVEGNACLELTFNVDDVNDLLMSMVVQDLGGGRISTVTYGSRDPVSKALKSFAIDLTENLTLADLFRQVRGEKVFVATRTPATATGTIVSVEARPQKVGDEIIQTTWLNLLTDDGLKSIPFDDIRSVRLLNDQLDQEMRKALGILSASRDAQKKTVELEFLGEGTRPVRVGYIQETPVWKTSYRLVLDDEEKPFLQGWAIVENTTDRDWEGVELALVSGRPISYVMNLYQPLYVKRPVIQPQIQGGVTPQTYDRELEELQKALEKDSRDSAPARRSTSRRRSGRAEGGAGRPGAPPAPGAEAFDIARGVEAAAAAAEVGELFQYAIEEPVHLLRQRSAMLPILNQTIEGEKISIFDTSVHPKHPLNGVSLTNSTAVHFMQGPMTVFDGGAYAGDALLGDMPPGSKRLISYAMDLEVEVAQEGRTQPDNLLSVAVVKGTLLTKHMRRRERIYVARNSDSKPRKLLIACPFDPNWTLIEPAAPEEKTRGQYRFILDVGAGKTAKLRVMEEQTLRQEIGLGNIRQDRISYYLRARNVSSHVKEALVELIWRKQAIDVLQTQYQTTGQKLKAIAEEQSRIRQNMAQIDHGTDLYSRYLKKFGDQEDEVEALRKTREELRRQMEAKSKEMTDWLVALNIQ